MNVELNHTIVRARDKKKSAAFLSEILGLPVGAPTGPFLPIETGNRVTLDFMTVAPETITSQHYAFAVPDDDFEAIHGRVEAAGITYWADPGHDRAGEVDQRSGGARGFYFDDPDAHNMEVLTTGSGRHSSA